MIGSDEAQRIQQEFEMAPWLDFEIPSEPWITIKTKDGAELKLKVVITGVKRISDDPKTGEARYTVASENKCRVVKQPPKRDLR